MKQIRTVLTIINLLLYFGSISAQLQSSLHENIDGFGVSPNLKWVKHFSGSIKGMVNDNQGNIYTYAKIYEDIEFLGEKVEKGIFISKQNPEGDMFWIKNFRDINMPLINDDYHVGNCLYIDTLYSSIYFIGNFTDSLEIPGVATEFSSAGDNIFILKYDLDGNYLWHRIEQINDANNFSLCTDFSGDLILSGTFLDTMSIDTVKLVAENYEGYNKKFNDAYIAKFSKEGNFKWVTQIRGRLYEFNTTISTNKNNDIYVALESLSETVSIGDSTIELNEGDGNILLAKFNHEGQVFWLKSKAKSLVWDANSWPSNILVDKNGDFYVKGWHGDSTFFDDIMLRSPYGYGYSYFIAKFDSEGNTLWANSITEHSYGYDYNQFSLDEKGNVYIGAQAVDTVHFGDDFMYINQGGTDLFVARYSTKGVLDWVKTFSGDTTTFSSISSVAVIDSQNIIVAGNFENILNIDSQTINSEELHGFIAFFGDEKVGVNQIYHQKELEFNLFPNPSNNKITISTNFNDTQIFEVYNLTGQKVMTINLNCNIQEVDIRWLIRGVYLVKSKDSIFNKSVKLVVN